jgi:hypothetical protein
MKRDGSKRKRHEATWRVMEEALFVTKESIYALECIAVGDLVETMVAAH